MLGGQQQGPEPLQRYTSFLATLRADLVKAQASRDRVLADIQAYEDLQANLQSLTQEGLEQLDSLVHLGAGVHAKARVPDVSRIMVDVGLGFHAECTLGEAAAAAELRLGHLRGLAEERSRQVASIKANISLVEQGLAGYQQSLAQQ